jgi:two-component system cell cycle response regulator DivK
MIERKATILLVEDDEDLRTMMCAHLCHAGYDVLEAVNGQHGVRLALAELPDMIFMDLEMPVLSGFDAIHQIRSDESCSGVPIIAISNHCWDFNWKDKVIALGCAECVDKGKLMKVFDDLVQRYAM